MLNLYAHNAAGYSAAVAMLRETRKAAIIHPTGTGKSFIGFKLAIDNPSFQICWLSPSEYIFKTQLENLASAADGWQPSNITFHTYAKLMQMDDDAISTLNPDYIILDEFHRCGAEQWGRGVAQLLTAYPQIPVLGFSATNIRYLDNQRDMADELFEGNIASEMTLGEAIVRGILAPPKYVISIFSYQKELEKYQSKVYRAKNKAVRDTASQYLDALKRTLDKAAGLDTVFEKHITDRQGKYIVFCSSVDHLNEMIARTPEWFKNVDTHPNIYRAYSDDPETSKAFADFKEDTSDHLKLLFCIDMLNEGVHVDDVSGVILFRPTVSPIIYKQQIGRALSAGKKAIPLILDVINNFDNLYSIGSIEEEMKDALNYYRSLGNGEEIVNESFEVIDEVRDCREIFAQLHETLSASWDLMYEAAGDYYSTHGNLNIPKAYRTPDKLSLGTWIITQRRVKSGAIAGILTERQIEKLNDICMIWDNRFDLSWHKHYEAAKKYYEVHGDLDISAKYITEDGIVLGRWITNIRQQRVNNIRGAYLTQERITQLTELGMIWDKVSYTWEQNYLACTNYYIANGNLDIPYDRVSKDGLRIGDWIRRIRRMAEKLTDEQITRLNAIGMVWSDKYTRQWERGYRQAQRHHRAHGNLAVPISYVDEQGYPLGKWLKNHVDGSIKLTQERKEKLDRLGMQWEKEDAWGKRIELCRSYYESNGNLDISQDVVVDGVWLGKWISEQRKAYKAQGLTGEQVSELEGVGVDWLSPGERLWERYYAGAVEFFEVHGHLDVPGDYRTPDGLALRRWVNTQLKRRSALSAEQIQRLNAIKIDWQFSRVKKGENIEEQVIYDAR
jgi:DNA or RNA helicases of superfamily II